MNITILGSGRWASYLAWYLHSIHHRVCLWGRNNSKRFQALKDQRSNEYLTLDSAIQMTDSLQAALDYSDLVIIAIASQGLRALAKEMNSVLTKEKTFVLAMKGLEKSTGKRLSIIMEEEIPQPKKLAVWVGPTQVEDALQGTPNCMIIASNHGDVAKDLVQSFSSSTLRLYVGLDVIGSEIGAALKNVIGIIAGMLDGLHLSSLKGALMARGTLEVSRLVETLGGKKETIYGLSHLGDYEATLFSKYSHNRAFGEAFIRHETYPYLAEGYDTTEAVYHLAKSYQVSMPIIEAAYAVLFQKQDPYQMLHQLLIRESKEEFA